MIADNYQTDVDEPSNDMAFDDASFEDLLDQYDYDMPYRGQILEGTILEATEDEVLIDVGLKRDAIVTRKDLSLLDDKLRNNIKAGNTIMLYVLQPRNNDGELVVSINKALELEDWEAANDAFENDQIVQAEVVDTNRGGILVRFGRLNGFVPQSHIVSLPRFASQDELHSAKKRLITSNLSLKFIEIDRRRNRLILSERAARADMEEERMAKLEVGQVVKGRVVSIVSFGAFVDLGGVDGLIHISKLDHHHINHPGEVLAVGDEVEVLVEDIDSEQNRISLNRVALLPDPWKNVENEYSVGDLIEVTATNVVDFGIFAQLSNGLQGLIHVSRMTTFGSGHPRDMVREGDELLVRIVSMEPERQRIGLSIDDVTVEEQENWLHSRHELNEDEEVEEDLDVIDEEIDEEDIPEAMVDEEDEEVDEEEPTT